MEITTRTDFAICASRMRVIGPAERDRIILQYVTSEVGAERVPAFSLANCCKVDRDAGEIQMSRRTYWQSGAIWSFSGRQGEPKHRKPYGFLTNCGKVLSEQEYFDRYVL
jgi:hypothetical protein